MIFILALSVGNHLMAFLAAPAMLVFVLLVEPRTLLSWRLYVAGAVALALGLSVQMFLPIRAALDPLINEADPACASLTSAMASIISWGKAGCVALSDAIARGQYTDPGPPRRGHNRTSGHRFTTSSSTTSSTSTGNGHDRSPAHKRCSLPFDFPSLCSSPAWGSGVPSST